MTRDEALVEMDRQLELGVDVISGPPELVFAAALHGLSGRTDVEAWRTLGRGLGTGGGEGDGGGLGDGLGRGRGNGDGRGYGCGDGVGAGNSYGTGHGYGEGNGFGSGTGHGNGPGYGPANSHPAKETTNDPR